MLELDKARLQLEELGMSTAVDILESRLQMAAASEQTYISFLNDLLDTELTARRRRKVETKVRLCNLPYKKTLEEFDFSFQPTIDKRLVEELATMNFLRQAANLVLLGPPGVGKTHLAVGLAMRVIESGHTAYFVNMTRLMEDLRRAHVENRLDTRMRIYLRPKLLVIDEAGYMPLDPVTANLFFQLINTRYEQGSIILTSNKSFGEWGEFLGDSVLATATLDRLLHHSHILNIRGQSYRLKDKVKAGIYAAPGTTRDTDDSASVGGSKQTRQSGSNKIRP